MKHNSFLDLTLTRYYRSSVMSDRESVGTVSGYVWYAQATQHLQDLKSKILRSPGARALKESGPIVHALHAEYPRPSAQGSDQHVEDVKIKVSAALIQSLHSPTG